MSNTQFDVHVNQSLQKLLEKNVNVVKQQKEKLYISHEERTFQFDESLPSLPVPPLSQTLDKYLDTVRPHVTSEEFEKTRATVENFKNGIGAQLHQKLLKKSQEERNWLEKWWENFVYLSGRTPLLPLMNMCGAMSASEFDLWPPVDGSHIDRTCLRMYFQLQFWKLLRREGLKPHKGKDGQWSMDQWRRLFNTVRLPGIGMDQLQSYFKTEYEGACGPTNVIVLCKGHIFSLDVIDGDGEPLLPQELASQFHFIQDWCDNHPEGPGISSLTLDKRDTWAKNRNHLLQVHPGNRELLELIEQSLFVVVLDENKPTTPTEILQECFSGNAKNRWADKSICTIAFRNGTLGMSNDHTPFDGLVSLSLSHFTLISLLECGGTWKGSTYCRDLPHPRRLEFHLDNELSDAIENARLTYRTLASNVDCRYGYFHHYGKDFVRPLRFHPEAYVQMALQFAYYRLHHKFAPTYVTASTRKFYHGRTETCRSCFPEATEWAAAMLNNNISKQEKLEMLGKAIAKFQKEMSDAMENQGCDRHLLGLYVMAMEEGMEIHELYTDPSFVKSGGGGNYILSTSSNGYTPLCGGAMAMCDNGYGTFYSIENDRMTFCLTAFKNSSETSVNKFYNSIEASLLDMRNLIMDAKL